MSLFDSQPVLTLRALAMFVRLDAEFRFASFQAIYQRVTDQTERMSLSPAPEDVSEVVGRTVAAIRSATRYYYRSRKDCLPKALTLFYLLRAQQVGATLLIGVKKYPFGAHAWVEYDGEAIDESIGELASYTILSRT